LKIVGKSSKPLKLIIHTLENKAVTYSPSWCPNLYDLHSETWARWFSRWKWPGLL